MQQLLEAASVGSGVFERLLQLRWKPVAELIEGLDDPFDQDGQRLTFDLDGILEQQEKRGREGHSDETRT
jgi:hypothetical protein